MFLCFYVFSAHAADLPMGPPAFNLAKAQQAAIALRQKEARDKAQAIAADKKSSSQQKAQALSNLQNSLSQAGVNTRELTLEISRLRRQQELIAGAERAKAKALSTGVPRRQVSGSSEASTLSTEKMNQRDQEIVSLNKKLADKKMTPKQREYEISMTTKKLNDSGLLNAETSAYMGALSTANNQQPSVTVLSGPKTKAGSGASVASHGGDKDKKKTQKTDARSKITTLTTTSSTTTTLPAAQPPELQTFCDKCNFAPKDAGVGCSIKKNGDQLMMSSGDGSQAVNLISRKQNESLWSEHAKITKSDVGGGYYKSTGGGADIAVYSGGVWNLWKVKFENGTSGSKTCNVELKTDLDPVLEASKQTKSEANTFLNPSKWSEKNCKDNAVLFSKCGAGSNSGQGDLDIDRLMTDGKGNFYVLADNGTDTKGNSEIQVYKATKSGMKLEKMAAGTETAENGDQKYGRKGLFGKVGDFFGGKHGMTSIAVDDIPADYSWVKDRVTHQCAYKSAIEKMADKQSVCKDLKQQKQQQETEDMLGGAN